jgi:hypothetical protein
MATARKRRASVFACDSFAIYAVEATAVRACHLPNEFAPQHVHAQKDGLFSVETFQKVWASLVEHRQYLHYDWTVKVDPEVVFFPLRLRKRLWLLRPPDGTALYFKSANASVGFAGAIEVWSKEALERFFLHDTSCRRALGHCLREDRFTESCLDMVGAGFMEDDSILSRAASASACSNHVHTGFLTFGGVGPWVECYERAQAHGPEVPPPNAGGLGLGR